MAGQGWGADLFLQEYSGSRFDQSIVSMHVGPHWLINGATEASLLAVARQRWVGTDPYSDDLGMRFESSIGLCATGWERPKLLVPASLQAVRFSEWNFAGFYRQRVMAGDFEPSGGCEVRIYPDRPGLEMQQSDTPWGALGASVALPRGYTVGGEFAFYRARHKADWSTLTQGDRIRGIRQRSGASHYKIVAGRYGG